jgi:indolepyruvate ferredoxin oxidoreductase alpha subunit
VLVVADDPGMHSSQNEQDSRYYAEMARVICLEPANQQQAYQMTREAFDLSEKFQIPVMIRLVTRLAHSRSVVQTSEPRRENTISRPADTSSWTLLPANARRRWRSLIQRQPEFAAYSESSSHNELWLNHWDCTFGVITTGLAENYFLENAGDLKVQPSHLHVGAYPLPVEKIRRLAQHVKRILVLEEGQPFLETRLDGIIFTRVDVEGKQTGHLPPDGEMTPDIARVALGLPVREGVGLPDLHLPNRPPQLCAGCPHSDSFSSLKDALKSFPDAVVTSDIGCYTLGALPPYCAIESCVCMGASIGMAKGASEAGLRPAVAVIGDSTFLHSGVTALMDAVAAATDMTLIILDNETVGMTGGQPTILPSSRLEKLILALGVESEQFHVLKAHPKHGAANTKVIRSAISHEGVSVIVMVRECVETARRRHKTASQQRRRESTAGGQR